MFDVQNVNTNKDYCLKPCTLDMCNLNCSIWTTGYG